MLNLENTPYMLEGLAEEQIQQRVKAIEERVKLLRQSGIMTADTLKEYYGEKRFEQVAESNAIEGSTLSAGETELAVMKGITITGHDPAYAKDAIALDSALTRITELARCHDKPTDISQIHEIHSLLLGDRAGAGIFRKEKVIISGAKHVPPKTWSEVMDNMEHWQRWSTENATLPAPVRCAVLHAWLAHVHPYIDGNGRTARAVGNLELIRSGYPPIIIKKKERERYIESLAESDDGGDIRSFFELIFDRVEGALMGLELSAKKKQSYDPFVERLRQRQAGQLRIWETSVRLLASIIEDKVGRTVDQLKGICHAHIFNEPLDLLEYIEVCLGHSVTRSWAFNLKIEIPGIDKLEKLAYIGHRSSRMYNHLNREGGPSLYWSTKNPDGFPKWISDQNAPFAVEITALTGNGDEWYVRLSNEDILKLSTTALAQKISESLMDQIQ